MGFGCNYMESDISISKDVFDPDEAFEIHFDTNNSECKKDIKSYKIKLFREIAVIKEGGGRKNTVFTK